MALIRYQNQLPDLFDRFFNSELEGWNRKHYSNTNTTLPSVNIKETNEAFEVEVAAPGFDKKDFHIELDNDVLTISSDKQLSDELKDGEKVSRQEFSYQSFTRSFSLPELVESDKISAKYENGILQINIPKMEEAKPKPARQIAIK